MIINPYNTYLLLKLAKSANKFIGKTWDDIENSLIESLFIKALERLYFWNRLGGFECDILLQCGIIGINSNFNLDKIIQAYKVQVVRNKIVIGNKKLIPTSNAGIKNFIKLFAPSEIYLFGGGEISIGLNFAVQAGVKFKKAIFLKNFDRILKA